MRASGICLGLLAIAAPAALAAPAAAQPVGDEFQVNTYTNGAQNTASVASDGRGSFVVVWANDAPQDGNSGGIFGQLFDDSGAHLGDEFQVNSYTTGSQDGPKVAAAAGGDFAVLWDSAFQDGAGRGVFGQRFDRAGSAQGDEFQVNSYTTQNQLSPAVTFDASGRFVAVWQSRFQDGWGTGIFAQRYDSAGVPRGSEFRVNSHTPSHQNDPAVASDASGNFVVVWASDNQDGDYFGIFGQRYDSAGIPRASEFRVNSSTTDDQVRPSVASDAEGNFVVVWASYGQDGNRFDSGVFGQRYDSAGVAQGEEFQVNSFTDNTQRAASVASDASGNFVVVWEGHGNQDGDGAGIFGQRYDSEGVAQGDEFQINIYTTSHQEEPFVTAAEVNQFVVVWRSNNQDGSGFGVFGRRFHFGGAESITVLSPNTAVRWRIGSQQKIQWTHTIGANASFRIEIDRDDDGDYEELIAAAATAEPTRGSFTWIVTGPPSGTARLRVAWTDDPGVFDSSDVTFQIRPPALSATDGAGRATPRGRWRDEKEIALPGIVLQELLSCIADRTHHTRVLDAVGASFPVAWPPKATT